MGNFERISTLCNILIILNFILVIFNAIKVFLCIYKKINSKKNDENDEDICDKKIAHPLFKSQIETNDNIINNLSIEPG